MLRHWLWYRVCYLVVQARPPLDIINRPLLFAPLSEVVGRTLMYQVSMFFFFIFTLPSALAKNAATLVVARQIAGLAASAPICNVGGT